MTRQFCKDSDPPPSAHRTIPAPSPSPAPSEPIGTAFLMENLGEGMRLLEVSCPPESSDKDGKASSSSVLPDAMMTKSRLGDRRSSHESPLPQPGQTSLRPRVLLPGGQTSPPWPVLSSSQNLWVSLLLLSGQTGPRQEVLLRVAYPKPPSLPVHLYMPPYFPCGHSAREKESPLPASPAARIV